MYVVKTIQIKSGLTEEQALLIRTINLQPIVRVVSGTNIDTSNEKQVRFAIPYFANGSLAEMLSGAALGKSNKRWTATQKSMVAFGLAVGLKFLHTKDVICGFLNPRNVLLTAAYEPVITDYWYLMCADPVEYVKAVGDDIFVAPEVRDGKISRLSDIYSYGMILLSLLSGCTQFDKGENLATYLPTGLATNIVGLVTRCWSPVLSARPSLSDFLDLFQKDIEFFPGTDGVVFGAYRAKLLQQVEHYQPEKLCESPSPIGEIIDDKGVEEMYKTEVEKQNRYALLLSGIHRREGKGCTVNKKIALKLFKSAAEKGIPEAQAIYGLLNGVKAKGAQGRNELALWTKAAADGGDSSAQLRFALMAASGQGVAPDHEIVDRYMRMAIAQNNVEAAVEYADMLNKGTQVPQNSKEARKYLKIAADLGHADSQLALAQLMLDEGSENYEEIAHYLRVAVANGNLAGTIPLSKLFAEDRVAAFSSHELASVLRAAADKGDHQAQTRYAELVIQKVIPASSEEIVRSYKIVADNDNIDAMRTYADKLRKGEGVQRNLAAAATYYQKAADLGDVISQYRYGTYLFDRMVREGGPMSTPLSYLRKAADAGYAKAQYRCGVLLRDFVYSFDRYDMAFHYFDEAAKQGDIQAKVDKANMMLLGHGCKENVAEATALLKEAADQGSDQGAYDYARIIADTNPTEALRYFEASSAIKESVFEAACMYDSGIGTPVDSEKAFQLFQKAADMGDIQALYEVGLHLKSGTGVAADPVKAAEAIRKAAEQNCKKAMYEYADYLEEGFGCSRNVALAMRYRDLAENDSEEEEDDLEPSFGYIEYPM